MFPKYELNQTIEYNGKEYIIMVISKNKFDDICYGLLGEDNERIYVNETEL